MSWSQKGLRPCLVVAWFRDPATCRDLCFCQRLFRRKRTPALPGRIDRELAERHDRARRRLTRLRSRRVLGLAAGVLILACLAITGSCLLTCVCVAWYFLRGE